MIATFKVKNFLSFKEFQELSFIPSREKRFDEYCCVEVKNGVRLLRTALVLGANASGKTNLLLALECLKDLATEAPSDKTKPVNVQPFLLDDTSELNPTIFDIEFYLAGEKYSYELAADRERVYTETLYFYPKNKPSRLFYRSYDYNTDSTEIEFGPNLELNETDKTIILGNTLNNCTVLATFGKSNVTISKLNPIFDFFADTVSEVMRPHHDLGPFVLDILTKKPECKDFLVAELQKSDFNICDIEIEHKEMPISPEVRKIIELDKSIPEERKKEILRRPFIPDEKLLYAHCTENGVRFLPQDVESRGTLRFTGLVALLYELRNSNSIVMIDEAETSLHYAMMSHFIEEFLSDGDSQSQLIITTHNPMILNELFVRRDTVWFTEKNNNGETILSRLSDKKKLHSRVSAFNAYLNDELGGKPNIVKTYFNNRKED